MLELPRRGECSNLVCRYFVQFVQVLVILIIRPSDDARDPVGDRVLRQRRLRPRMGMNRCVSLLLRSDVLLQYILIALTGHNSKSD